MNPNMLLQMMQSMGMNPAEEHDFYTEPHLPAPYDTLYMLRPMLPPREQRFVDILIKMHELQALFAEMQNDM